MKKYKYYEEVIEVPEVYFWVATDEDGEVWCYAEKPFLGKRGSWWIDDGGLICRLNDTRTASCDDWQDTLRHISQLERIDEEPQAEAPQRYGNEWRKEMMKLTKAQLIDMIAQMEPEETP